MGQQILREGPAHPAATRASKSSRAPMVSRLGLEGFYSELKAGKKRETRSSRIWDRIAARLTHIYNPRGDPAALPARLPN